MEIFRVGLAILAYNDICVIPESNFLIKNPAQSSMC